MNAPIRYRSLSSFLVLPLLFLVNFQTVNAQTDAWFTYQTEDGKRLTLEEFMASSGVTGLSLVVMNGRDLDTCIALGYRNAAEEASVTKETMFNAGAMSETMYQYLALKAASEGRIDLDVPVLKYLTSWKFPEKGWMKKDPVTVRDLLLQNRRYSVGYKSKGQTRGSSIPSFADILAGKAEGPALEVTKRKNKSGNYSYGGHLILRAMLEDVYGMPIETAVEEEILEPLEMENSLFLPSLPNDPSLNVASGYRQNGNPIPGGYYDYPIMCSGGLWTTPTDYGKFVAYIFQAAKGDDFFLREELARQAITAQHEARCLIFNKGSDLYIGGASQGFYTTFGGKPETGTIVIVFTNSDINWKFNNQVAGMGWDFARRNQQ